MTDALLAQSPIVLDTNIVSYLFRQDPILERYLPMLEGHSLVVAAQTVAEMHYGMFLARWGEDKREQLERLLSQFRVIYPNNEICSQWGKVRVEARRLGRPIDVDDAWIAATALELNIPLVTHNRKDFDMLEGLTLLLSG